MNYAQLSRYKLPGIGYKGFVFGRIASVTAFVVVSVFEGNDLHVLCKLVFMSDV